MGKSKRVPWSDSRAVPDEIKIDGCIFVRNCCKPLKFSERTWDTYTPKDADEDDDRIYERARETGQLLRTR